MSNNNLIPFEFNGKKVRTLVEEHGEVWFVVKDIATIIKHTNPSSLVKMVDEPDLNKVYVLDANGRRQKVWVTNESGVYQILLGSHVKEAKPFCRWVTSEVLPSIRKTGSYTLPRVLPPPSEPPLPDIDYAQELKKGLAIADTLGIHGKDRRVFAVHWVRRCHKVDILAETGFSDYFAAHSERRYIPTELAKQVNSTPRVVNLALERLGLQKHSEGASDKRIWNLTDKGRHYGRYYDIQKEHSNGAPVQQIFWWESVIPLLENELTRPVLREVPKKRDPNE